MKIGSIQTDALDEKDAALAWACVAGCFLAALGVDLIALRWLDPSNSVLFCSERYFVGAHADMLAKLKQSNTCTTLFKLDTVPVVAAATIVGGLLFVFAFFTDFAADLFPHAAIKKETK